MPLWPSLPLHQLHPDYVSGPVVIGLTKPWNSRCVNVNNRPEKKTEKETSKKKLTMVKIKLTTMNLCGADPTSTVAPAPPFEFNDGSPFAMTINRSVASCIKQPESSQAQTPFVFDSQHLHPLMSRPVIGLFQRNDGLKSLHDVFNEHRIYHLLVADRDEQPRGIGGRHGLPSMTTNGVCCAFEINSCFMELLTRAHSTYVGLMQKKEKELRPLLQSLGIDWSEKARVCEALATAQVLFATAQLQMVCNGGVSMEDLRQEYSRRIKPNPQGLEKLLAILFDKIQQSDGVCINEVSEGMIGYLEEHLPKSYRLYCQAGLEGQDTVFIYNTQRLQPSDGSPGHFPHPLLFLDTMATVKTLEEIRKQKKLKDVPRKANFLLEFDILHQPGIVQRHLGNAEGNVPTGDKIWIVPVHLSSNGDHVPIIPTVYDVMRRHKPSNVKDIIFIGDFNNTAKTHDQFLQDTEYFGIPFTPPLHGGPEGRGIPSSIKMRDICTQFSKHVKPVSKTCDGILCESIVDKWEVFSNTVVASSETDVTSFSFLPTPDYISDHFGVSVTITV